MVNSSATWNDFRWLLLQKAADQESVELEVINENNEISNRHLLLSVVREQGWEGDGLERLGISFYRPEIPPVIGNVVADGPAARAGLKSGDKVLRMDGRPIVFWHALVIATVRDSAGRSIRLDVERQEQIVTVNVIPEGISERGRQGRENWRCCCEKAKASNAKCGLLSAMVFLPRVERRSLKPGTSRCSAWS
jgi:regulator of sigma E protease